MPNGRLRGATYECAANTAERLELSLDAEHRRQQRQYGRPIIPSHTDLWRRSRYLHHAHREAGSTPLPQAHQHLVRCGSRHTTKNPSHKHRIDNRYPPRKHKNGFVCERRNRLYAQAHLPQQYRQRVRAPDRLEQHQVPLQCARSANTSSLTVLK